MTRKIAAAAGIIAGGQLTFKIVTPGYPDVVPIDPPGIAPSLVGTARDPFRAAAMLRHPAGKSRPGPLPAPAPFPIAGWDTITS